MQRRPCPPHKGVLVSLLLLALTGSSLLHGSPVSTTAPVNDAALKRHLEAFANEVVANGDYTRTETLIEQLSRTRFPMDSEQPLRRARSFSEAARRVRSAVACVGGVYLCRQCEKHHCGTAAGFFIRADGILVTCYHVVNKPDNVTMVVMTAEGVTARVLEVLAADSLADVAILRVEGGDYPTVRLQPEPEQGASIGIWSHPNGEYYFLSEGIVARRFLQPARHGDTREMLSVTADFALGSSGGPVFDLAGNVVGMAASTRSLYSHDQEHKQADHLQMVLKNCTGSANILRLLEQ